MMWAFCALGMADPVMIEDLTRYNERWRVVRIDPARTTMHLLGRSPMQRTPLAAWKWAVRKGWNPLVVMNGGMFHLDRTPVGLFVDEEGTWTTRNLENGEGNFFLKPNGIFGVDREGKAFVVESSQYKLGESRLATQSGPMLVVSSEIHPTFRADSSHERIRNGVGITRDGAIVFVISQTPVLFYDFAQLMRIDLQCSNALYLDGVVSVLQTKEGIIGSGTELLGPMLVVGERLE